jgi:murein DD-endopeptidase MepM/ murein hydrolase activator NlpD
MKKIIGLIIITLFFTQCAQFTSLFGDKAYTSPKATDTQQTHSSAKSTNRRSPIVTKKGIYYFVAPGDRLDSIAKTYRINEEDLAQINNLFDSDLSVGRRLFIPHRRNRHDYMSVTRILKERKIAKDRSRRSVKFIWPLKDFVLTSKFGMRRGRPHDGIDISAPGGTPVLAAAEGQVLFAKRFSGYGNLVVLKHASNYFTAYSHNRRLLVSPGQIVKQGEKIATVGRTGRASGNHVHFEIHKGVDAIDPLKVLPKKKYKSWK